MSDRFKDFKPDIGGFTSPPASAPTRDRDTYSDFDDVKNAINQLISMIDAFHAELEKQLATVAMPVGDFDPRLVEAHKYEWPEDAGPLPSSVSYRYYKALGLRDATTATYIRDKFEEAARDVAGTSALDLFNIADIARDEALLARDFLNKHIDSTYDTSEQRVIEALQDWVQSALVQINKMQSYHKTGSKQKYLSRDQLDKTTSTDAKQGQAVFKVKLNSINDEIARDMDSLKRNFAEFAPVFYEKFLGPAMDFRLKVSRKARPGTSKVNSEIKGSSDALSQNLKTVIADQTRRQITYKTKVDRLTENIKKRDKYKSLIGELAEKGKPVPNAGPRVLTESQESPEEVVYWASDYAKRYNPDQPRNTQGSDSGSLSASHASLSDLTTGDPHGQYLLRTGGRILGDVFLEDGVRIDGVIPSEHTHTGEDGTKQISGKDIIGGSVNDDVVDTDDKPATPFNLRITNYKQSIIPPGLTTIDATLTWDGNPDLAHEVQIVRI